VKWRGDYTLNQTRLGKIKKWILPGEGKSRILAVIGGKADRDVKIIYKKYGIKASQHVTLKITKDGLVDIHITEEGRDKKYTSLFKGHIDLPYLKERALSLYQKSLEPIDVNNPLFLPFYVLVPKSAEAFVEFYLRSYIQGDKLVLPTTRKEESKIEGYLEKYFDILCFEEAINHRIWCGFCVKEEGDMGILLRGNRNYYFFSITSALQIFLESIRPDNC
jgi:hypothetical protein